MAHEGSEDSAHARDEKALPAAALPAPAPSPAPENFSSLVIRPKPRNAAEEAREQPKPQNAAGEWDFLSKKKHRGLDDSESSIEDASEFPEQSQIATVKTTAFPSEQTRVRTWYDGNWYTGKKGSVATWMKTIQDKFGKRVQELIDPRLMPHPDPFRWSSKTLRLLRHVVKGARSEEQVNEVLWWAVAKQTEVNPGEQYPLKPLMVKMAITRLEELNSSNPEFNSEEEENAEGYESAEEEEKMREE